MPQNAANSQLKQQLHTSVPSLKALVAFEVAARCGRFSSAAVELNVTQPAVSRLVSNLEAHLEVELLLRTPTGLKLTEPAGVLFAAVSDGLSNIQSAISEITRYRAGKNIVTLSLPTATATHWLLPKLSRIYTSFPNLDLKFQLAESAASEALLDADLGIRLLDHVDKGLDAELLVEEKIQAVCSPSYLDNYGPLTHKNAAHTFIHLNTPVYSWEQFLTEIGVEHHENARFITFSDYSLAVQAAKNGQGIALGWNMVVADGLQTGELVSAAARSPSTGRGYYILQATGVKLSPSARDLKHWLVREMKMEAEWTS